jgi:hypothetical protein
MTTTALKTARFQNNAPRFRRSSRLQREQAITTAIGATSITGLRTTTSASPLFQKLGRGCGKCEQGAALLKVCRQVRFACGQLALQLSTGNRGADRTWP